MVVAAVHPRVSSIVRLWMPALPAPVAQDLAGRIVSWRAGHTATGMGARSAQVQPGQGHAVVGVSQQGACGKDLIQSERAMHDVAIGQAKDIFQVQRCWPGGARLSSITLGISISTMGSRDHPIARASAWARSM